MRCEASVVLHAPLFEQRFARLVVGRDLDAAEALEELIEHLIEKTSIFEGTTNTHEDANQTRLRRVSSTLVTSLPSRAAVESAPDFTSKHYGNVAV